jgi:hypothetical protein
VPLVVPAAAPHPSAPESEPAVDVAPEPAPPARRAPPNPAPRFMPSSRGDDFQASHPLSMLSVRAEELHDVQQEADFFVSLGEYERAIEVLRSHINMNPDTSALAWLDLLEIFHKLGRREDFDWVRGEVQGRFNAKVPPFDSYRQEDIGLEGYEQAMSRIVALWPSRRVLDVIEESIFRGPGLGSGGAFSLQAYRDLLLLHHIGTEVLSPDTGAGDFAARAVRTTPMAPSGFGLSSFGNSEGFSATAINPLSAATRSQPAISGFGDIDLDINLDEPVAATEEMIGRPSTGGDSHLLDFDLPDIDSGWQPRKTGVNRP